MIVFHSIHFCFSKTLTFVMFSRCVSVSDTSPFKCPYCKLPSCGPKLPTQYTFIFSGLCPSNVCEAKGKEFYICELCQSTQRFPKIYGCSRDYLRNHSNSKKHKKYLEKIMNELLVSSEGTSISPSAC